MVDSIKSWCEPSFCTLLSLRCRYSLMMYSSVIFNEEAVGGYYGNTIVLLLSGLRGHV